MKTKQPQLELLKEFNEAPSDHLFKAETVAALRQCSIGTLARERLIKKGIPYLKLNRMVRYRKADILEWLGQHPEINSSPAAT